MGARPLTETPLVSVVLVTWNSARFLPRCLAGIARQTHENIEVIHVDNGSTDEPQLAAAVTIRNDTNRGFAAAVNQGIAASRGAYVLLLNPDAFLERDYVDTILAAFANADATFGMATGKLLVAVGEAIVPTARVDSKGIRMTRSGRHFDIDQGKPDEDAHAVTRLGGEGEHRETVKPQNRETRFFEVFGVSGAAAMYTRAFIDDVSIDRQFLDEDFHTFREDADVAWRGRLFGWRAMFVPGAIAYHVRTVTPDRRRNLPAFINMHSVKNRFLLRLKNEGGYLALRNAPFELTRDLVALAAVLTIERGSLPALDWLWKNRRRIMAKRREIQRRRRVSDRALAGWFR